MIDSNICLQINTAVKLRKKHVKVMWRDTGDNTGERYDLPFIGLGHQMAVVVS